MNNIDWKAFETNMSLMLINMKLESLPTDLEKLVDKSYELADTCGFPFYKNTANVGKQGDCVIPCDLTTNVEELHTFLFEDENYTPSNTVEAISDKITTKTGYSADDAVKTSDPTEEDHTKTDDVESTETE